MGKRKPRVRTFRAQIEDLTHDGRGVARIDGKTVFVHGALPGEDVTFTTYRSKRSFDEATADEIHTRSAHRIEPRCEVFGVCGGCALQHLQIEQQHLHKRAHLKHDLEKIGQVTPKTWLPDLQADAWNYRRRARLGVKHVPAKEKVLVGFRERRAPYIAAMNRCEILSRPSGDLLEALSDLIGGMSIYNKLAQIEVAVGDTVTAFVFRVLEPPSNEDQDALLAFGRAHSVDIYLQPGGPGTVVPLGAVRKLSYFIPKYDVEIEFQPLDFIQVNGELNRQMISHVIGNTEIRPGDRVLDLFCGLGNFSLPLARCADYVVGVEGDASLVDRAKQNARHNSIENVEFHTANLFEPEPQWPWIKTPYDVVLIDPPRAGAQEILPLLASTKPRVIAYVSCHPGTLARDAGRLVKEFGYKFKKAGIMDMFPHTAHVESVAIFER